jgi:3-methyladenine DNA glycosylase/8-oxoguanine DNA glycosylase
MTVRRMLALTSPRALGAVLGVFRRGPGDPTYAVEPGAWWLAWHTPAGPVTARLGAPPLATQVDVEAWGAGAQWFVDRVPHLLGEHDSIEGFTPHHALVGEAWRRFHGWRVPASGLVTQMLIPAVIEQKVTGQEAFAAYRRLVRRFGTPAPGPGGERRMVVPPDAAGWAAIPSWEWLGARVDIGRSAPALRAAQVGNRLDWLVSKPVAEARWALESIRGIGRWTSAEVAHRALGDPDAVSFGDYHVAKNIGWALTGSVVDDDGLAELLEPYAGHRYRVQRLLELAGHMRPRRGPRMAPRTHLPG